MGKRREELLSFNVVAKVVGFRSKRRRHFGAVGWSGPGIMSKD